MSRFEHPKDKVNTAKPKVLKDMKEELSDTIQEVLMQLNITAKVIEYTPYQQQQNQLVSEEIKHLSQQNLGKFAEALTKQMQDREVRPYMEHLDRLVLKKMRAMQQTQ